MEKMFMSAGIVTVIIVCLVGLLKLPFKSFKGKHSKLYKAVFTAISMILTVGLSVLDQLYILGGEIFSVEFGILVSVVSAGVSCGYGGVYEGLGVKELVKHIVENIKKARVIAKDKKFAEYLTKIDKIDEVIKLLEEKKNINAEV